MSAVDEYRQADDAFGPEIRRHRNLADAAIAELEADYEAMKVACDSHIERWQQAEAELAALKAENERWKEWHSRSFDDRQNLELLQAELAALKAAPKAIECTFHLYDDKGVELLWIGPRTLTEGGTLCVEGVEYRIAVEPDSDLPGGPVFLPGRIAFTWEARP